MAKILIIDDDKMICKTMHRLLTDMGHDTSFSHTAKEGLEMVNSIEPDLVFLDVRLPDGSGLDLLPNVKKAQSNPEVVIVTGYADPDGAELALKNKAWDYIHKPASIDTIALTLNRALAYRKEKQNSRNIRTPLKGNILGKSPQIRDCLELVARAAESHANVLISGETGTGKELFARAIHKNSDRTDRNFVVVDCSALPENLMESLLFGHTKGAFTGAVRDEEGLIMHADGGTLFLDEVGELPLYMQKVFLRVLQERRFHPVGATREVQSDFRLVAATNRDLEEMVKAGDFRDDLLFRLRSVIIHLPPLRNRKEDIKELSVQYLKTLSEVDKSGLKGFSADFFDTLEAYSWPGNIRELYSALDHALSHALHEATLYPMHLPSNIRVEIAKSAFPSPEPAKKPPATDFGLLQWKDFRKSLLEEGEKRYLTQLLDQTDSNVKTAAKRSGLSVPRIYELLRKYGLSVKGEN